VTLRVLICDDQALVRAGFRKLLEARPNVDVVGEAGDGLDAVDLVRRRNPDLVLMDIRMPGMDGIEATRRIIAASEGAVRVLMLTTFGNDEYVYESLCAGASAFLLKDATPEELLAAIDTVARGDALLAPAVTRAVIEAFVHSRRTRPELASVLDELTSREREVLTHIARGCSNAEIAGALFIGEATVKSHVGHILLKTGARDRVQAVIFAYESGLVGPQPSGHAWASSPGAGSGG
jgi:DNA-binding NarL/FixJ family response regulator